LCRLALLRWMICFLAALSSAAKAVDSALAASDLLPAVTNLRTCLPVFLMASKVLRLKVLRLVDWRMAFCADLVLGISSQFRITFAICFRKCATVAELLLSKKLFSAFGLRLNFFGLINLSHAFQCDTQLISPEMIAEVVSSGKRLTVFGSATRIVQR